MADSRVYQTVLYTVLLALLLLSCALVLLYLFMLMVFFTDPGMDTEVMTIEILLAALGITAIYAALYSIYGWCFAVIASPGATQAQFLRTWPGTLFVVLFVAVSLMMSSVPLSLAFTPFDRPTRSWFVHILLRVGTVLELVMIGWTAQYVVRAYYYAHSSGNT